MRRIYLVKFLTLIILLTACEAEEDQNRFNLLQNEKGWYAYEYKRHDIGAASGFLQNQPYIIIGEYGSGFKISPDGTCHIHYSEGDIPIQENVITRNWEMIEENKIRFISQSSENIEATIVEITREFLWIKYESVEDNWEYKLRRIE